MKKRKLLALLMAVTCVAMPFAACDNSEQGEAVAALKDNFVYTDGSTEYTKVSRLDGKVVAEDKEHNLLAVEIREQGSSSNASITQKFKVYDLETGKIQWENYWTFSADTLEAEFYSIAINYPLIEVSKPSNQTYTNYDYYVIDYSDGGADSLITYTRTPVTVEEYYGMYEITTEDEVYWLDSKLETIRIFNRAVTDTYSLRSSNFKASHGGYLYAWQFNATSRVIQVYNKEGICSMQYTFPSDVANVGNFETLIGNTNRQPANYQMDAFVLEDGNILVQEWAIVEDGDYDFSMPMLAQKFKIETKIINYLTGEATKVDAGFFVDALAIEGEESDFPFELKEGKKNQALITNYTKTGVSEMQQYVVLDNGANVTYTFNNAQLDMAGYDGIQVLSDEYYVAEVISPEGSEVSCVFNASGEQVLILPSNMRMDEDDNYVLTDDYYVTKAGIYDYARNCVFDFSTCEFFTDSRYYVDQDAIGVFGDSIYVYVEDEVTDEYILYTFNGETKQLEAFGDETVEVKEVASSYYVTYDYEDGTYTFYNKEGVAKLKTQGHSDVQNGAMHPVELNGYVYVQAEIDGNPVVYVLE